MADIADVSRIRRGLFSSIASRVFQQFGKGADTHLVGTPDLARGREPNQTLRLFEVYENAPTLCYADTLFGHTVVVVDPGRRQLDLQHWLANNCLQTQVAENLHQAQKLIEAGVQSVGLVLIDLESCGGISRIIGDLLAFRRRFVDTPIVLISAESEVDDFSTERLAISDVTLRAPVSVSRLDLALAEAQINNQVWQSRNRSVPQ